MEREQTTIRLPLELKAKIQKEADRRGMSFNGMLNLIIVKGMEFIDQGLL